MKDALIIILSIAILGLCYIIYNQTQQIKSLNNDAEINQNKIKQYDSLKSKYNDLVIERFMINEKLKSTAEKQIEFEKKLDKLYSLAKETLKQ